MTNADFNETEEILFNFPIFYLPKHLLDNTLTKVISHGDFGNNVA